MPFQHRIPRERLWSLPLVWNRSCPSTIHLSAQTVDFGPQRLSSSVTDPLYLLVNWTVLLLGRQYWIQDPSTRALVQVPACGGGGRTMSMGLAERQRPFIAVEQVR